jgi:hypothetical protein
VLSLQYFGAEKDIFPFDRNAKTFVIALFVLLFALPSLAYVLDRSVCVGKDIFVRLRKRPKKTNIEAISDGKHLLWCCMRSDALILPDSFDLQPQLSMVAAA